MPATVKSIRSTTGYSDDTGPRLLAFLASMRPIVDHVAADETYQSGRDLIVRLSASASGENQPTLRLSMNEVADIVNFLSLSVPAETSDWWRDPKGATSHVAGHMLLMQALEDSLRALGALLLQCAMEAVDEVIALNGDERGDLEERLKDVLTA